MSQARPTIAAIIPVHNGAGTIARAIRSIQRQTVPVDRIVVVDDHSTDGTRDRLEALHDPRLLVLSARCRGAGHARNLAVGSAGTDLVAFLDADDVWYPDKLRHQLTLLRDDVAYVGTIVHYLGEDGRILGSNNRYADWERGTAALRRAEALPVHLDFGLMTTERFLAAGGYDESFLRGQDFDLAVRLVQSGARVVWPRDRVLGGYVLHDRAVTATSYREQFLAAELVRARLRGGTAKSYAEWMADPDLTRHADLLLRSGDHYRQAAVAVGQSRMVRGAVHGAIAAVLSPRSVSTKLRWRTRGASRLEPRAVPADVLADFKASPS